MNKDLAKHFKGRNFFTPTVIEYGETKDSYYELSVGDSPVYLGHKMYGVTIASGEGSEGGFESEELARDYIKGLL